MKFDHRINKLKKQVAEKEEEAEYRAAKERVLLRYRLQSSMRLYAILSETAARENRKASPTFDEWVRDDWSRLALGKDSAKRAAADEALVTNWEAKNYKKLQRRDMETFRSAATSDDDAIIDARINEMLSRKV